MGPNRPSLTHPALDLEHDLMRAIVDYGPLTGRYLAAQEARERSAHGRRPSAGRATIGIRPAVATARRRLGLACVSLGLRLQGIPPVARVLALPGEQNAA